MNGETQFRLQMQQQIWNCTRERFRASRKDVFIVCQQSGARVVTRSKGKVILTSPLPSMSGVVFYDGAEAAAEAAEVIEKRAKAVQGGKGVELVAVSAYEYAKAREYACRNELAKAGSANHG